MGNVSDLLARVNDLRIRTKIEKEMLDQWLEKSDGEQVAVEQKKQRFRRMEKWNAVFSYQRASKRKVSLLKQFGRQAKAANK